MRRRIVPRGLAAGGVARLIGGPTPISAQHGRSDAGTEHGNPPGHELSGVLGNVMAQLSAGLAQLGTALQHPEGFVQSNRESGSSGVNSGGSASKLVFGYTVRVGQAGISAEPFGNVPQPARKAATPTAARGHTAQEIAPRQPIVDVFEERGVFVIIAELPGTSDSDITCTATGNAVRIETTGAHAYAKDVDLPAAAIPETLVSRCQNGILEVRVQRRDTCT